MLPLLDDALYVLHFAVLAFAITGWMHARTRIFHRWLMGGIGFCWLGIGPMIGEAGFCPLTWLQGQVQAAMGVDAPQVSYIDSLLMQLGMSFNAQLVDIAASSGFIVLIALALLHWSLETGGLRRAPDHPA